MSEKRRDGDIHQRLTEAGQRIASSGFSAREICPQLSEVVTNYRSARWRFAGYRSIGLSVSCVILVGLFGVWFFIEPESGTLVDRESTELKSVESSDHSPETAPTGTAEHPIVAELLAATFAKKHQFRIPRDKFATQETGGNRDSRPEGWLATLTRKRQFRLSAISNGVHLKDQFTLPKLRFHLSAPGP